MSAPSPSFFSSLSSDTSKSYDPYQFEKPHTALSTRELEKRFPGTGRVLFQEVSTSFLRGGKYGLAGVNGSGKSTFLKILGGQELDFDGEVAVETEDVVVGYLSQEPELDISKNVLENVKDGLKEQLELVARFEAVSAGFAEEDADFDALIEEQAEIQEQIEAKNCWDLSKNITDIMSALKCPDGDKSAQELSGGEVRRVALARLLLSQPEVLLLDEPTNHLDARTTAWLQDFLQKYEGTLILITHDRYFLSQIVGHMRYLDSMRMLTFKGTYEKFAAMLEHLMYNEEAKKMSKTKRKKLAVALAKGTASQKQRAEEGGDLVLPEGPRLGKQGIVLDKVGVTWDDTGEVLFDDLTLTIGDKTRLGIVGPNGAGKSTLFRVLTGELQPTTGTVTMGETVKFAYVNQSRAALNEDALVWEEIAEDRGLIEMSDTRSIPARLYVSFFNFRDEAQSKRIGHLSGGERNRVHLAKTLSHRSNVLLLDEPTNDLDIQTLTKLESGLVNYNGAAVIISHDRLFLDSVCNQILLYTGDGRLMLFEGNYSQALAQMERAGIEM
jgi:sulfate-transporting ATPase